MKKIAVFAMMTFFGMASVGYTLTKIYAPDCFAKTKDDWTRVYNELVSTNGTVEGHSYITSLNGNGHADHLHRNNARDTIVFIPESTTIEEPVDFIFYFHGLGGFKERDFRMRTLRHTISLSLENNYVLIIPEMPWSRNTVTPRRRQGRVFTKRGQFATFTQSVNKIVNDHFKQAVAINKAILIGHSAGGSTLMSISKSGGMNWLYEQTNASEMTVVFSDASYGRWLDIAWRNIQPRKEGIGFIVLTRKHDRPYNNARRFIIKSGGHLMGLRHIVFDRRQKTHGDIGDEALLWAYEPHISGCGEGE